MIDGGVTLVTGAVGFLGPHLVWEAAARGPVLALDRQPLEATVRAFMGRDPARVDRVTWVSADVTDYDALVAATRGRAISHVMHAAAMTPDATAEAAGMRHTIAVNVLGTATVLDLARALGVRRTMVVSSSSVYAANDGTPLAEDAPWRDSSGYAVSKQSIERLAAFAVSGYGMDVVAVRPAALFGPMERPTGAREAMSGVYRLMYAAIAGEAIRIHDDGVARDLTDAGEAARAVVALLHAPSLAHRVYNIGVGRGYTIPEILDALRVAVPGAVARLVSADEATTSFGISVRRGALDMSRFRTDVGYGLSDELAAHLVAYRAWLRDHPY